MLPRYRERATLARKNFEGASAASISVFSHALLLSAKLRERTAHNGKTARPPAQIAAERKTNMGV
jgi:hypothetical protein